MRKIIPLIFLNLTTLSFASFSDETDKMILKKKEYLKQERVEKELREKDTDKYKTQEIIKESSPTENKFYIDKVILTDTDNLLDKIARDRIIEKYINKKLGSTDITNLLTELTNKLIEKGYITSVATISEDNDLTSKTLNLKIVSGKVDKISFNQNSNLNNLKKFFLIKQQEGEVLNIRNLDTTTENFNYLEANNMKMDIVPSDKLNYSNIKITNKMKDKFTISLLTNNHGENKQDSLWRYGTSLNIDSPLGIGDNFYFSYMTVHKKKPNRDLKKSADILEPGEIAPIGPPNYNPEKGDKLPYKRNLNLYNLRYSLKFRDYTLSLNSSKTFKENSFYTSNTVYDFKSINKTHSASLNKILWRNQKNKISLGLGLKRKHNKNYLETSTLANRVLAIGNLSLNGNFTLWKGLLGVSLGYERGLRALGAESDKHKIATTPKAEFNKYTLNANYYKPFSDRLAYRLNLSSSYSNDVLYGSEKQTVGGVGSVGGYNRTDNIQGDRAIEIENELSYKIINSEKFGTLSPYISYSYGAVRNNKNKSKYRKGYMSGALLGLRYNMKYFDFDVAYAKPLSHSDYLNPRKQEIYFSAGFKIKL
ncbi:MAG: ShlB/FhaC/HecB family hemolysin secretion/activation protein [Fusobacterium sp.]|nr:ShlB/FhaC/HecB family hemolysin secretion/activation protein [Fusobacterium sp.]